MKFWEETSVDLAIYYHDLVTKNQSEAMGEFISLIQYFLDEFAILKKDDDVFNNDIAKKLRAKSEKTLDSVGDIEMPSYNISVLVHILRTSKLQDNNMLRELCRRLLFNDIKTFLPNFLINECDPCSNNGANTTTSSILEKM